MKAKELIKRLSMYTNADVVFEQKGHKPDGESTTFSLAMVDIYGYDKEVTIVLLGYGGVLSSPQNDRRTQ